jgi:hypothetical protein
MPLLLYWHCPAALQKTPIKNKTTRFMKKHTSWTETLNNLEATENMLNFRPTYLFFGVVCCFRSSNFLSSSSSCKQQVQYVSSLQHREFFSEGKSFGGQKQKFTAPNKSQELIPDHRSFPYHQTCYQYCTWRAKSSAILSAAASSAACMAASSFVCASLSSCFRFASWWNV